MSLLEKIRNLRDSYHSLRIYNKTDHILSVSTYIKTHNNTDKLIEKIDSLKPQQSEKIKTSPTSTTILRFSKKTDKKYQSQELSTHRALYIVSINAHLCAISKLQWHIHEHVIRDLATTNKQTQTTNLQSYDDIYAIEKSWVSARKKKAQEVLSSLLHKPIDQKHTPTIAIAVSGGSFRAMFATLGLLDGLEKIGLLDAVSYMTTVSGSTWLTMPWLISNKPISTFYDQSLSIAQNGLWTPRKETTQAFYRHIVEHSLLKKPIYSIDWYAYLLADKLLGSLGNQRYKYTAHDFAQEHAQSHHTPFPIGLIAGSDQENHYHFLEWTPTHLHLPKKNNAIVPPMSIASMLATGGSSFCLSLRDLIDHAPDYIQTLETFHLFHQTKEYVKRSPLANKKIFGITLKPFGPVFDAGYLCNIPLQPLLDPKRNVDIIILLDNKQSRSQAQRILRQAQMQAEQENLPCPSLTQPFSTHDNITIYKNPNDKTVPTIIYVPLQKNNTYDQAFDPSRALFCHTFNFTYSRKQAKLLAGLVSHTIKQHKKLILDEIEDHLPT